MVVLITTYKTFFSEHGFILHTVEVQMTKFELTPYSSYARYTFVLSKKKRLVIAVIVSDNEVIHFSASTIEIVFHITD